VKTRKLRWYRHVIRSNGLYKTILQGTVLGKRKRDRQKKKWTDNITEWTKKTFAETQAVAHNRDRQKKKWADNITEWTMKTFAETQAVAHNRELWTHWCFSP